MQEYADGARVQVVANGAGPDLTGRYGEVTGYVADDPMGQPYRVQIDGRPWDLCFAADELVAVSDDNEVSGDG